MHMKWTAGRVIKIILAVLLTGLGVLGLWTGLKVQRDFESWKTCELMEGAVDLSAGEFVFTCVQNARLPHGAQVRLELPPEMLGRKDLETVLAPLRATLSITNAAGRSVEEIPAFEALYGTWGGDEPLPLFYPPLLGKGTYQVTIRVLQGVPALKGLPQRVEGLYILCGCEAAFGASAKYGGLSWLYRDYCWDGV